MTDWIEWCIALIQTSVQWLGSVQLLGVSGMWIILASLFVSLIVRAAIFHL